MMKRKRLIIAACLFASSCIPSQAIVEAVDLSTASVIEVLDYDEEEEYTAVEGFDDKIEDEESEFQGFIENGEDSELEDAIENDEVISEDEAPITALMGEKMDSLIEDPDLIEGEVAAESAVDYFAEEEWQATAANPNILYKYEDGILEFKAASTDEGANTAMGSYTTGTAPREWLAFHGDIKKIVIHEGITEIGKYCFRSQDGNSVYSSLEEVVLPESVRVIRESAFQGGKNCKAPLKTIDLSNVRTIEQQAFQYTDISAIEWVNDVELGSGAFASCGELKSVIGKNIKMVGSGSFGCFATCKQLETFKAETVTLSRSAFSGCSALKQIDALIDNESIPNSAFSRSGIETVDVSRATEIGAGVFTGTTNLTRVDLPNVTRLGKKVFAESSIKKVLFGKAELNFEAEEEWGFAETSFTDNQIEEICYPGTLEQWKQCLAGVNEFEPLALQNIKVHCKEGTVKAVDATCEETGLDLKDPVTCSICEETYAYETVEIPALGHKYGTPEYVWSNDKTAVTATVICENDSTHTITETVASKAAVVKEASCKAAGEKTYTAVFDSDYFEKQTSKETIPITAHKWGEWTTISEASATSEGKQERTCSVCGEKEIKTIPKLKATIKLSVSGTVPMKVKQTAKKAVSVSGLALGDTVKKVASSNTKIVKVSSSNGTITLKAQSKTGMAKVTVTLASGLEKTFKVKVQKTAVKTSKIKVASKKVTLKKGKSFDLKAAITPVTSQQKLTYKTSKSKVATVSKKGVIKAKKAGKATITVKSGKKSVKIKVTVK